MDWRESLFQIGYSLFASGVKGVLNRTPKDGDSIPQRVSHKERSECIGCTIHIEVGQAYLYVLGISERVSDSQPVPKGVAGTLDLAKQHINNAQSQLTPLYFTTEEVDSYARELADQLPEIERRLVYVKSGKEIQELVILCGAAWRTAYKIPEAIYRPRPASEVAQLKEEVKQLETQIRKMMPQEATDADRPGVATATIQNPGDRETPGSDRGDGEPGVLALP